MKMLKQLRSCCGLKSQDVKKSLEKFCSFHRNTNRHVVFKFREKFGRREIGEIVRYLFT